MFGILFLFLTFCGYTQTGYKYSINNPFKKEIKRLNKINALTNDSLQKIYINKLINSRKEKGYVYYETDTNNEQQTVSLNFKGRLLFGEIEYKNGIKQFNQSINRLNKKYNQQAFSEEKFNEIINTILTFYQNNGYPFVTLIADSSSINSTYLKLICNINQGPLIKYDSITIKGNVRINKAYLYRYTNIKPGKIYSENDIKQLDKRFQEINFIKTTRLPDIVILKDKARLTYYLDKQNINQFDGFAGFLPDNTTGKVTIVGQAQVKLINSFALGEQLEVVWRKLQPLTQDLKLTTGFPIVLGSRFGFDNQFKLYKRDTTFIDITNVLGLQYFINQYHIFKITLNTRNSNLLTPDMYKYATVLPNVADLRSVLYGIGIKSEHLDYRLNPRKGYLLNSSVQAGTRRIIKNNAINETLYNGLPLTTNQYMGALRLEFFIPILKKSTINVLFDGGTLFGSKLFRNELYRLGGLYSLRGFDEESINASSYFIQRLEYRFIFEQNSGLYAFFNSAWYENKSTTEYSKDFPFGFGAGIFFKTKAGIFTINYALGKQSNNPIYIQNAKIHFGLVNYF